MASGNVLAEIGIKHEKVRQLIKSKKIQGLLLGKNSGFKWFACGKMNDVIKNDDVALVYLLITEKDRFLVATKSDADRVMKEELEGMGFSLVLYEWYNQSYLDVFRKLGLSSVGSDLIGQGLQFMGPEISGIRTVLTEQEIQRFEALCGEYKEILTSYCLGLKPGISEIEAAAGLAYQCHRVGIRLPVLMVGSDDRIFAYRHPCSTPKKIEKYVLFATVGEKDGICANVSRSVYFGKCPQDLKDKQDAVNMVQAVYIYYSNPGATLGELFEIGKKAYGDVGYPGEWENHLQGGIAGYTPLEYLALENSQIVIKENNLVSWNPTIKGTKSEDPVLVRGLEKKQFTLDTRWPAREYKVQNDEITRPIILEI